MYIVEIPNRGGKPTILLRESYREDGKVKNRTLANLTKLPPDAVEAVRGVLGGEGLVPARAAFEIDRSVGHGHVEAVLTAIRRLGLDRMIASRRSRERSRRRCRRSCRSRRRCRRSCQPTLHFVG